MFRRGGTGGGRENRRVAERRRTVAVRLVPWLLPKGGITQRLPGVPVAAERALSSRWNGSEASDTGLNRPQSGRSRDIDLEKVQGCNELGLSDNRRHPHDRRDASCEGIGEARAVESKGSHRTRPAPYLPPTGDGQVSGVRRLFFCQRPGLAPRRRDGGTQWQLRV